MAKFHIANTVLWVFVTLRFLLPLSLSPNAKIMAALFLLLASQQHFLIRRFRGSAFSPELPRPLGMIANALFGTFLFLITIQIGIELLGLLGLVLMGEYLLLPQAVRYTLALTAVALPIFGVVQAVRVPSVKEIEVELSNLPSEFEGYRLVHLTDLHLSRLFPRSWAEEVVRKTNAQKANLVVTTGDLLDGTLKARENDIEPLRYLEAPDGVFTITGNHEYYYGYEGWMQKYRELGMTVLSNSHVQIRRGASSLVLAGVTDLASQKFGLPNPDLRKALEGAPPNSPIILLDHKPGGAAKAAREGVALQLSGHTHGGMVRGLDYIVARFNKGFVSGFYDVDGMKLYVSNGTALWNGFAIRLGVPSELTVITLRGK